MKMLKITAAALAMLWAVNVNAADDDKTQLSVRALQGEKKAVVRVVNLSGEQASVLSIKDQAGRILYKESIKSGNVYAKKYDFSSLPAGVYAVEIAQGQEVTKKTFNLESQALSFKTDPSVIEVRSVVEVEPNLVKVLVQNQKTTDVKLRLYDGYGKVLHEESVAPNQTIAKGLNLSKVGAGRYSIAVTGENYQYTKNIVNEVK
jgi:hypothetical protein